MAGFVSEGVLDPTLGWILRLFLAATFARALSGKLRSPTEFASAIRGYELIPATLVGSFTALLLAIECLLVPTLLIPAFSNLSASAAAGLLCLYTLGIGINLVRGRRDIDCGCAGPRNRQNLHELLIVRNLVYAGFALAAAMPTGTRALGWLDDLTIGLAVACLFSLSIAIDGLAALAARSHHPRALP